MLTKRPETIDRIMEETDLDRGICIKHLRVKVKDEQVANTDDGKYHI